MKPVLSIIAVAAVTLGIALPKAYAANTVNRKVSGEADIAQDVRSLTDLAQCPKLLQSTLDNWGVTADWIRQPTDLDGGQDFASPTGKIGAWAEVIFYPDHSAEAYRYSPTSTIKVTWSASDCNPRIETNTRSPGQAPGLTYVTDADVDAAVGDGSNALIYAWSPQMPISVIGFAEARTMAKRLGLKFIPVLDAGSDATYAAKIAGEHNFPPDALRRSDSVELTFRQMGLHCPSTLVVSKGKFSRMYPGHWVSAKVYEEFIRSNLK